ncbi:MAG TPA: phenylalanine--tRNA ligase subunit alpha [Candidatus Binatia bacterium]|nr:phenylalanine--tRNA ligase subunit alpha [Candidatus Binatia bacterium]
MSADADGDLHDILSRALAAVESAADVAALDAVRARYLGRGDGELTLLLKAVGGLASPEARRQYGISVNEAKRRVQDELQARREQLEAALRAGTLRAEALDLTWPPPPLRRGHLHAVTRMSREIRRVFTQLGYLTVDGPEVEYDRYNFTLVNMPPGHPSRDTQDTFYIDDSRLLRTQTSPVQIRAMIQLGVPLRVIVPGKCFRRDNDATHSPQFHQVEGLLVDEGVTVGDLKGTLEYFARSIFGADRAIRLRPHHFEFTEPSLEMDVSCMTCGGKGCPICKHSGWIEVLGSGMVHPDVLRNGGADPHRYTGFAFGFGIERAAQLAYGIDDVRLLYENDVRLVRQG